MKLSKIISRKIWKKNKMFKYVYLTNLVVVNVLSVLLLMLSLDVYNQMIKSDNKDLQDMLLSIVIILGAVYLFLLWLLSVVQTLLINSREKFNIGIIRMGLSNKKLAFFYTNEIIRYFLLSGFIAVLISPHIYYFLANELEIKNTTLNITVVITAFLINVVYLSLSNKVIIHKKYSTDNVVNIRKNKVKKKVSFIDYVLAILVVVLGTLSLFNKDLDIVLLVVLFCAIETMYYFLIGIVKNAGCYFGKVNIYFTSGMIVGDFKKVQKFFISLVVGISLITGLLGSFQTIRESSKNTVQTNIYFENLVIANSYENNVREFTKQNNISEASSSYALNMEGEISNKKYTVLGIDSSYLVTAEKLDILKESKEVTVENLNNSEFQGIYLPANTTSEKDIGKTIDVSIGEKILKYTISGRFVANGSRGRWGVVSLSNLQKQLNLPEVVNSVYFQQKLSAKSDDNRFLVISKEEIAKKSYDTIINGVEVFVYTAIFILVVSIILLGNYLYSKRREWQKIITQLEYLSVLPLQIKKIFAYYIFMLLAPASIIGTIVGYYMMKVNVLLQYGASINTVQHYYFPLAQSSIIFISCIIITISIVQVFVNHTIKSKKIEYLVNN